MKHPVLVLATGFGSGLAPRAPGTFGTLAAIPLYLLVAHTSLTGYTLIVVFMFLAGIWICGRAADILGVHDHPGIVWDEIVGYLITMYALPASWMMILLGFIVFRFFDILKPWPIRQLDKNMPGGTGIMLDDVVAGIMANIVLQAGIITAVYLG